MRGEESIFGRAPIARRLAARGTIGSAGVDDKADAHAVHQGIHEVLILAIGGDLQFSIAGCRLARRIGDRLRGRLRRRGNCSGRGCAFLRRPIEHRHHGGRQHNNCQPRDREQRSALKHVTRIPVAPPRRTARCLVTSGLTNNRLSGPATLRRVGVLKANEERITAEKRPKFRPKVVIGGKRGDFRHQPLAWMNAEQREPAF